MLGAMLLDSDAVMRAAEHVDDTMFYREGHRRLFRAMFAITERGASSIRSRSPMNSSVAANSRESGGREYLAFLARRRADRRERRVPRAHRAREGVAAAPDRSVH